VEAAGDGVMHAEPEGWEPEDDSEQTENIERVAARIEPVVLDFCREAIGKNNSVFHMEDLRTYVVQRGLVAPDSPGRILRLLRQKKKIDYLVINRRQSVYLLLKVENASPTMPRVQ
jgi:hypothetical protein